MLHRINPDKGSSSGGSSERKAGTLKQPIIAGEKGRRIKCVLLILGIILVLAGVAVALYFFVFNKSGGSSGGGGNGPGGPLDVVLCSTMDADDQKNINRVEDCSTAQACFDDQGKYSNKMCKKRDPY